MMYVTSAQVLANNKHSIRIIIMIIVCEILRLWEVSDNPITQSFYVSELQIKHSLFDSRICELNYYAVITIL